MRRATELHNKKVKKNREISKRLIDCVIFWGKQELSFRGHNESAGSKNQFHERVLDNIICQTQTRFQDHEKLMFVSLLDLLKFREYHKSSPHVAFSSLTQSHGALFDLPRLRTELTVMYAMDDFAGKSPTNLLDFLQQKNLSESMEQLSTFVCLAVTIPVSTASVERTFSALNHIKKIMPEIRQGRRDSQH